MYAQRYYWIQIILVFLHRTILSKAFWEKWSSSNPYYKAEKLGDGTKAYKKVIVTTKMDPVDFEGNYF